MTLPDNRIRLPSPKIDFDAEVGTTGQRHDTYPAPQEQARFDHLRMYLIGLLSQQSSYEPPDATASSELGQYRDGTPWFDLNELTLKIRYNNEWRPLSEVISVRQDETGGSVMSLSQLADTVLQTLPNITPDIVYNGVCTNNNVSVIPIPAELRTYIGPSSRALVYVNGLLLDPRNTALQPLSDPAQINLVGTALSSGDTFTVNIRYVPAETFYTPTVTAS